MTPPTSSVQPIGSLHELRQIVPTEQIEPQLDGEQGAGGSWALEPATQVELVELLKWANRRHAAVFTRRPRRGDAERFGRRPRLYLRGRRMKRVLDLDIVSGTITVQSGITMAELHNTLDERTYTTGFPTRPWSQEPLGAVLAASLDAHWGPAYGKMESQVVGLGVVLPNGTAVESRVAPRKAVGPDFSRLFLGSRGRFGIVHQVTLRIYPSAGRIVSSFGAPDLTTALAAVKRGIERGLHPRAIEILSPTADRSWGRKRVGLSDALPLLVVIEPWGPLAGRPLSWIDEQFAGALTRLTPPVGWSVHDGLLPPPRAWTAPVVGMSWAELEELGISLGADVPAGLWVVRMSRQGGWLSISDDVRGEVADRVRARMQQHHVARPTPWDDVQERLERQLDPKGILNPGA